MNDSTCSIEGCEKPIHNGRGWCRMHYFRWYRNGDPGEAKPRKRAALNPECEIDGCEKPDVSGGLCHMHDTRKRRHGDPNTVIPIEDRNLARGLKHHNWSHDITYYGLHNRLTRYKGRAADHPCVDCGGVAGHWSHDHTDPDERVSPEGLPYSLDLSRYVARCVSCHKYRDLGINRQGRTGVVDLDFYGHYSEARSTRLLLPTCDRSVYHGR